MSGKQGALPPQLQAWATAGRRRRLAHAHVQMARELGMNPKRLGKIDNHDQERWKAPLTTFIEELYLKRFGRERPETVLSIEQHARRLEQRRAQRKAAKAARNAARSQAGVPPQATGRDGDRVLLAAGARRRPG